MPTTIRRVADFYNKKLTEEQIAAMCDHLSFENFKKNPAVNFEDVKPIGVIAENESFIRKGTQLEMLSLIFLIVLFYVLVLVLFASVHSDYFFI